MEMEKKEKGKAKMLHMRAERKRLANLRKTNHAKWCEEIAILDQIKRDDENIKRENGIIAENMEREKDRDLQQRNQDEMWIAEAENAVSEIKSLREELEEVMKAGEDCEVPAFVQREEATGGDWDRDTLNASCNGAETIFISTYFDTKSSCVTPSEASSKSNASAERIQAASKTEASPNDLSEPKILQPRPTHLVVIPRLLGTHEGMGLFPQPTDKIGKVSRIGMGFQSSNIEKDGTELGGSGISSRNKAYAAFKSLVGFLKRSRKILTSEETSSPITSGLPHVNGSEIFGGASTAELVIAQIAKTLHRAATEVEKELNLLLIQKVRVESRRRHSLVRSERAEFVEDHAFLPKPLRSRHVVDKEQERMKYEERRKKRMGVV